MINEPLCCHWQLLIPIAGADDCWTHCCHYWLLNLTIDYWTLILVIVDYWIQLLIVETHCCHWWMITTAAIADLLNSTTAIDNYWIISVLLPMIIESQCWYQWLLNPLLLLIYLNPISTATTGYSTPLNPCCHRWLLNPIAATDDCWTHCCHRWLLNLTSANATAMLITELHPWCHRLLNPTATTTDYYPTLATIDHGIPLLPLIMIIDSHCHC